MISVRCSFYVLFAGESPAKFCSRLRCAFVRMSGVCPTTSVCSLSQHYGIFKEKRMFIPGSLGIALLMMITSAICWGSWANTYKGVKNYRFELFYWDYAVGIFLVSLILAFTMGSTGNDASSFLNNVRSADTNNIVSTLVGGAIFNLANLLLVAAIDMAGLAIAFPVAIGIALVVGVISSYALQPKGNAALLA